MGPTCKPEGSALRERARERDRETERERQIKTESERKMKGDDLWPGCGENLRVDPASIQNVFRGSLRLQRKPLWGGFVP